MKDFYGVRVPATTANLGSGFDIMGAALNLYNEIYFEPDRTGHDISLKIEGEGAGEIREDRSNMIFQSMEAAAAAAGRTLPAGQLRMVNRIPLARGLGSSSAAVAGGIFMANEIMDRPLDRMALLRLAAAIEGHPDNAAPAVLGGICLAQYEKGEVFVQRIEPPASWRAVVCIPDFEVLTAHARAVLPPSFPRTDAVHNAGAAAFLLMAFIRKDPVLLKRGLDDRIHVPYRLPLIPGAQAVIDAALRSGAYGATISGSGSTMIAFCPPPAAPAAAAAMEEAFRAAGAEARSLVLSFDPEGISDMGLDK